MENKQFENLATTKLGNYAEEEVKSHFHNIGYTVFWSDKSHGSSYIDGMATSGSSRQVRNLIEVKCKTLNAYGNYSIAVNDLNEYMKASEETGFQCLIVILDHQSGKMNVTTPRRIMKSITFYGKDRQDGKPIIYFDNFVERAKLTPNTIAELRGLAINSKNENHNKEIIYSTNIR